MQNGKTRPELRGGFRKTEKYAEQKTAVIQHVQSFSCRASHYGRRGECFDCLHSDSAGRVCGLLA